MEDGVSGVAQKGGDRMGEDDLSGLSNPINQITQNPREDHPR